MIPNTELTNYQSQKENFINQISLELFKKLNQKLIKRILIKD